MSNFCLHKQQAKTLENVFSKTNIRTAYKTNKTFFKR